MHPVLFAYAAPAEGAGPVAAHPGQRFVELGVGPVRAAIELTRALLLGPPPALVCLFGVAGAYPRRLLPKAKVPPPTDRGWCGTGWLDPPQLPEPAPALPPEPFRIGDLVVVDTDLLADEGVDTDAGFRGLARLGLGAEPRCTADAAGSAALAQALGAERVAGATVSTCSGRDTLARRLAARAHAQVESMEGAAVGLACARFGVAFVQVRAVSNYCGDRRRGAWDLAAATARLRAAMPTIVATLTEAT